MDEYIIRDEAMSLPVLPKEQRIQLDNVDEAFEEGWRQALENLAILPAADVVIVVHCRECEHWQTDWEPNYSRGDEYFCAVAAKVTGGHFYCADGERKEET